MAGCIAAVAAMVGFSTVSVLLVNCACARRWPRVCVGVTALVVVAAIVAVKLAVRGRLPNRKKTRLSATEAMCGLIGLLVLLELVVQPCLKQCKTRTQWILSAAALFSLGTGFLLRQLEATWGRPLCLHSVWFQPHAMWHALTSIALISQTAAWRATPQQDLHPRLPAAGSPDPVLPPADSDAELSPHPVAAASAAEPEGGTSSVSLDAVAVGTAAEVDADAVRPGKGDGPGHAAASAADRSSSAEGPADAASMSAGDAAIACSPAHGHGRGHGHRRGHRPPEQGHDCGIPAGR